MTNPTPPAPVTFATAPEWLRQADAARLAGAISLRTLRRWIVAGHIHAIKPTGGMVLVSRDSLRAFLEGAPAASYYGRHYEGLASR